MWMSTPKHTSPLFSYDSFSSRPKRDLLPYVARHTSRHTFLQCALSKAQGPGLSVSNREPSGVVSLSRFCATASRSLRRCLLLGQRSRMNLFSNDVWSLIFQDRVNAHPKFSRHGHNRDPRAFAGSISMAHRAIKLSKLWILANRRPGRLNKLASKPPVAGMGNRASIDRIARGVLGRHQAQKAAQLSDIVDLPPVSNARQKLACHNPADTRDAHQILNGLQQFRIFLTETANLFRTAHHLLFTKFQIVEQLIELKTNAMRTLKPSQLSLHPQCPLSASRSWGKVDAFEQQQGFDPLLVSGRLAYRRVAQLGEVAQLAIDGRGHMNAFDLSTTQALRQSSTVEPVGLDSFSWSFGDHRRSRHQAPITLSRKPFIQPEACRSSLIDKGNLLIRKVLAHVIQQVLNFVVHMIRPDDSLQVSKCRRDTLFTDIQSGKHIIIIGDECFVSHLSASIAQRLLFQPLYQSTRGEDRHPSYKSRSPRLSLLMAYGLSRMVRADKLYAISYQRYATSRALHLNLFDQPGISCIALLVQLEAPRGRIARLELQ